METTRLTTGTVQSGPGHRTCRCLRCPSRIQCLAGLVVFESHGLNYDHAPRKLFASEGRKSNSGRSATKSSRGISLNTMSRSWHPMLFLATFCISKLATSSQQTSGFLRSHLMQSSIVLYLQVRLKMGTLLETELTSAKASQCRSLALWNQRTTTTLKHIV